MAKNIELRPLLVPRQSSYEQFTIARTVQKFVYEDSLRVGASEEEARSIADPADEERVGAQLGRMQHPPQEGTMYRGVIEEGILSGFVKLGPWLPGDAAPFGMRQRIKAHYDALKRQPGETPVGLHAFAVRAGLSRAALTKVYEDLVPSSRELHAAVHENDEELNEAFSSLGAPEGPKGNIKLGEYVASYVLRSLPAKDA